jgi:hypothetical protein
MELIMGGLLIGVSGMLVLLIVAASKETVSHRPATHSPHRKS